MRYKQLNKPRQRSEENCTNCGQQGHSEYNCWGNCPACGELGHSPETCQLPPERIRAREKRKRRRKRLADKKRLKSKMYKNQSNQNLPEDESSSKFWADSLSDGEMVIDTTNAVDNSTVGMISKNTDFRQAREEKFLMDSGAQVCIMGELMARENRLTIKSLTKPRNVI